RPASVVSTSTASSPVCVASLVTSHLRGGFPRRCGVSVSSICDGGGVFPAHAAQLLEHLDRVLAQNGRGLARLLAQPRQLHRIADDLMLPVGGVVEVNDHVSLANLCHLQCFR